MPAETAVASLSDNLLVATILTYVAAMLAYGVEYAFGARASRKAAPAKVLAGVGGGSVEEAPVSPPVGADVTAQPSSPIPSNAGRIAVVVTILGGALHVATLVTRAIAADRVPWGNMYEYALTVCFVAVVAWLVVLTRQRSVRHLGVFVMLPVVLLLGLAGTVLYTPVVPLVPALNSYWLWIHVSAATIASGIFMTGFAASALYLIRYYFEKRTLAGKSLSFPLTLGPRLPSAEALERTTFRVIAFAFPIWTFAIICGAIWAEAAWSRYWGWDPKETWAFISWVVYAAYLHARSTTGWKGPKSAWIAVIGWGTMMMNLFGVNLVISGLHSYAGLQ
ncbi:c-type cytochrome biogenesis protein CcsB [Fodinicola acaciae]|uniref:c-type cytochrome biogenesis protein CcsB n=1 Tax=Fodinicola acaciae TaxID=2681555 RepID=UPI001C9E9268|nr:c-type cytochrome biogenesis protein CcsB [Fodinicola acaciae]